LNNKNQGILLNFLSRIKPAYQRAYARRPGKDTNPKAVNLSGSVDVLIEIIGASGQPEYGTTNAVTVKVNSVGWADDCTDAGDRAMQEQLPRYEAQRVPFRVSIANDVLPLSAHPTDFHLPECGIGFMSVKLKLDLPLLMKRAEVRSI
jgi:hypothetical protein